MLKKVRRWFLIRKFYREGKRANADAFIAGEGEFYTREQMEAAFKLGYTDGKRDGLSVAREQATKSLKEILSWQNENQQ
jgi:ribonuclease I